MNYSFKTVKENDFFKPFKLRFLLLFIVFIRTETPAECFKFLFIVKR